MLTSAARNAIALCCLLFASATTSAEVKGDVCSPALCTTSTTYGACFVPLFYRLCKALDGHGAP
jgi:hypothetical protein